MGITAYEDTFTYKNIYKNIFTGINKEERDKKDSNCYTYKG
jgi:hypothetical protein